MPRTLAVLLALGAGALTGGCGSGGAPPVIPRAAPPQAAELAWTERTPDTGPALVFDVRRFEVTKDGWEAEVGIENETGIPWILGEDPVAVEQSFGIMLFATGGMDELDHRNRDGELPGLRAARRFVPPLPARLAPGARWRGTISAPGTLAAGRWVRVAFRRTASRSGSPGSRITRTGCARGLELGSGAPPEPAAQVATTSARSRSSIGSTPSASANARYSPARRRRSRSGRVVRIARRRTFFGVCSSGTNSTTWTS